MACCVTRAENKYAVGCCCGEVNQFDVALTIAVIPLSASVSLVLKAPFKSVVIFIIF